MRRCKKIGKALKRHLLISSREAAKKLFFLVARPLTFLEAPKKSPKNVATKLEGGGP